MAKIESKGKVPMIQDLFLNFGLTPNKEFFADNTGFTYSSSHKVMLEGIDFDLIYTPLKHLGYKAVLNVLGPLYSGGFEPESLSVRVALSKKFSNTSIEELWSGVVAAFKEHGLQNIDLDLLPSVTGLTISLSSQGKQKNELFVQRPSCKSSDLLCLSGGLGAAYLGLQILEREKMIFEKDGTQPQLEKYKFVLQAYLNPYIDKSLFETMKSVGIYPSRGEFVVNGLADSVKSICLAKNLGAKVFMNRIPLASGATEVAGEINIDPVTAALNGGDDYKFLFAVPLEKHEVLQKEFPQLDIIGHLCDPQAGALFVTPDGTELSLKAQGWDK
ncbi:MAG: thiamine-phosphate kinase [Bacteroidetes bacterium HGW-Bacteroidetes-8]|jgi:thiamine-monophosphate kinase|nr:MAG: thiamine-phosphate kinase [Bacteroidetes bacterium HGW-Bacteroidetes-8]